MPREPGSDPPTPLPGWMASALLACVSAAVVLLGAAMAAYPGGTWLDPRAPGHDFWLNFFCDLTQPVALNGAPNRLGAALGLSGMLALVVALGPFWWLVSRLSFSARLGAAARAAGLISTVGLVAVALTPSLSFGLLHAAAVLTASVPGLCAAALAVAGLRDAPALRWIGGGSLLVAVADAALYARQVLEPGPTPAALPVLQKVAALGLLAWMVGVGGMALVRRPSRGPRCPRRPGARSPWCRASGRSRSPSGSGRSGRAVGSADRPAAPSPRSAAPSEVRRSPRTG